LTRPSTFHPDRRAVLDEGFFVKAIAIYKKIIKLDPTRLEVYEKLAELYPSKGWSRGAHPVPVLADYYQKHDNAASAIAIYQKMADLEPNNPSYHVKLAEIYQRQQLIEKAVSEYRVIAEIDACPRRSRTRPRSMSGRWTSTAPTWISFRMP